MTSSTHAMDRKKIDDMLSRATRPSNCVTKAFAEKPAQLRVVADASAPMAIPVVKMAAVHARAQTSFAGKSPTRSGMASSQTVQPEKSELARLAREAPLRGA